MKTRWTGKQVGLLRKEAFINVLSLQPEEKKGGGEEQEKSEVLCKVFQNQNRVGQKTVLSHDFLLEQK